MDSQKYSPEQRPESESAGFGSAFDSHTMAAGGHPLDGESSGGRSMQPPVLSLKAASASPSKQTENSPNWSKAALPEKGHRSANTPIQKQTETTEHRVRRDETLGEIAQQYGVSIEELQRLNRITNPDRIRAGQTLRIPRRAGQRQQNSGTGRNFRPGRIEIHVRKVGGSSRVRIYQADGTFEQFICSPGNATPLGMDQSIGYPNPQPTPRLGLLYFAQITGQIGFHSNIANPPTGELRGFQRADRPNEFHNRPRHRWVELPVTGNIESSGCIRLRHNDARRLFNMVERGTIVRIFEVSWQYGQRYSNRSRNRVPQP